MEVGNNKIGDLRVNLAKKLEREKLIKKTIISNNDYFVWLEKFVSRNDGFADDDWLYSPDKINENDKQQVDKLCLFYEALSDYSEKNDIPELKAKDFYGSSVLVKFNDNTYNIGYLAGQGTFFFCNKINSSEKLNNVIDFKDVISNHSIEDNQSTF